MRILITGAGGRIGTHLTERLKGKYDLTLADITKDFSKGHREERIKTINLDITNLDDCKRAFMGIDTLIHLAGNPSSEADFNSVMSLNIEGTYNVFRAAQEAKVGKVIFASSAQTVEGYPLDMQTRPEMPVRPKNLYGVSKVAGEALASYFAHEENLPIIALRIGAFDEINQVGTSLSTRDMSAYLSPRDLSHLVEQCLMVPMNQPFEIINAISNNKFKRLDISKTKDLFGYEPIDDGFEQCGYKFNE